MTTVNLIGVASIAAAAGFGWTAGCSIARGLGVIVVALYDDVRTSIARPTPDAH